MEDQNKLNTYKKSQNVNAKEVIRQAMQQEQNLQSENNPLLKIIHDLNSLLVPLGIKQITVQNLSVAELQLLINLFKDEAVSKLVDQNIAQQEIEKVRLKFELLEDDLINSVQKFQLSQSQSPQPQQSTPPLLQPQMAIIHNQNNQLLAESFTKTAVIEPGKYALRQLPPEAQPGDFVEVTISTENQVFKLNLVKSGSGWNLENTTAEFTENIDLFISENQLQITNNNPDTIYYQFDLEKATADFVESIAGQITQTSQIGLQHIWETIGNNNEKSPQLQKTIFKIVLSRLLSSNDRLEIWQQQPQPIQILNNQIHTLDVDNLQNLAIVVRPFTAQENMKQNNEISTALQKLQVYSSMYPQETAGINRELAEFTRQNLSLILSGNYSGSKFDLNSLTDLFLGLRETGIDIDNLPPSLLVVDSVVQKSAFDILSEFAVVLDARLTEMDLENKQAITTELSLFTGKIQHLTMVENRKISLSNIDKQINKVKTLFSLNTTSLLTLRPYAEVVVEKTRAKLQSLEEHKGFVFKSNEQILEHHLGAKNFENISNLQQFLKQNSYNTFTLNQIIDNSAFSKNLKSQKENVINWLGELANKGFKFKYKDQDCVLKYTGANVLLLQKPKIVVAGTTQNQEYVQIHPGSDFNHIMDDLCIAGVNSESYQVQDAELQLDLPPRVKLTRMSLPVTIQDENFEYNFLPTISKLVSTASRSIRLNSENPKYQDYLKIMQQVQTNLPPTGQDLTAQNLEQISSLIGQLQTLLPATLEKQTKDETLLNSLLIKILNSIKLE